MNMFTKEEIFLSSDEEDFSNLSKSPPLPKRSVTNVAYCSFSSHTTNTINDSSSSTASRSVVKNEPSGQTLPEVVTPDKDTKKTHQNTMI